MDVITKEYFKLGIKFCRHQFKNGGVCIFVHESKDVESVPTHHICKEQDIEIYAIKLNLPKFKIVIVTIYRSPTGNCNYFLMKL